MRKQNIAIISNVLILRSVFFINLLLCIFSKQLSAQTISIDTSSPRQRIVTATGLLGAATLNYARNPMALCIDVTGANKKVSKKILLSWFINIDNATVEPTSRRMTSMDGGKTWGPISGGTPDDNVYFGSAVKTKSGKIVAIEFKPTYLKPGSNMRFPFKYYTSKDDGDTWTKHTDGLADFSPREVTGMRFHKGVIEEPDGSLYTNAYLAFSGSVSKSYILKSVDTGRTWKPMFDLKSNPIFVGMGHSNDTISTNESTLARCVNGDWLVVMRQQIIGAPLLISRSKDKGFTWSQLEYIKGLPNYPRHIDPKLMLMPNGVMVLSYGRPDQHLLFSADGNGYTWTNEITTYKDADEAHATSANSAIVAITSNKLLQFGDYYAMTSNPNTQGIWQKEITVMRAEKNAIILKQESCCIKIGCKFKLF